MNNHSEPDAGQPRANPSNTGGGRAAWPQLRPLAVALTRTLGSVTALVVVYYSLPLDQPFGSGPVLALLGGLVLVALLTAWQVRSVLRSPHPGLRAAETLALTVSLILLLFAAGYQALAAADPPRSANR